MNYTDFIKATAEACDISQKDAKIYLTQAFSVIEKELKVGGEVAISKFGKFKAITKPERTYKNPITGDDIVTPEHKAVKFSPASALKESVR